MYQNEESLQSERRLAYADQIIALRARPAEIKAAKEWSDLALEFLTKNGPQPKRVALLLEVFDRMRFFKIPPSFLSNEAREDFWSALEKNNTIEVLSFGVELFSSECLAALIKNSRTIFRIEIEGPILLAEQDVNNLAEALSVNKSLFSVSMNCYGANVPINTYCERNFQRRMVLPLALLVLVLLYGTEPTVDENNREKAGFPPGMPRDLIIKLMMISSIKPNQNFCNKLLNWMRSHTPVTAKNADIQDRARECKLF